MEKNAELKLLRPRSMASVITDGYRLYMGSFRPLFRSSWLVALVYALAFALAMGNVVFNLVPLQATILAFGYEAALAGSSVTQATVATIASTLFFAFSALLLAAQAIRLFGEHRESGTTSRPAHWYGRLCLPQFLRLLVTAVWMAVLMAIVCLAFYAVVYAILSLGVVGSIWKSIASAALLLLLAAIVMALLLPFSYTAMRSLLGEKLSLAPPVKGYVRGLRHWGLLFATALVVFILTELLTLVCELPATIMAAANAKAYSGLAIGDPLGLPEHITPITYCVFFFAGFIQAYVHLSTLFPFYYAFGSIELQEEERKAL